MAPKTQAAKRRRTEVERREQREDRLSSLPDAILIEILSFLPLSYAITTEVLSNRWRGLWTNVTSIHIDGFRFKEMSVLKSSFDDVMLKLTSPFFHSFSVDFCNLVGRISMGSWLHRFCEGNLLHLQLTGPEHSANLPSIIFRTQSLVSIELDSAYGWKLPDECGTIDLPNLKMLSLRIATQPHKWLEKLIEGCPSLENLSLDVGYNNNKELSPLKFPLNLRRLSLNLASTENIEAVINSPKLEYFAIRARKSANICFLQEQIELHEAKIELFESNSTRSVSNQSQGCQKFNRGTRSISKQSQGCQKFNPKFFQLISNVRILTLNFNALTTLSLFPNVTQLTLTLERPCDFEVILSRLLQFPKLDVLIFKFCQLGINGDEIWTLPESECARALRQVKRIEIDTHSGFDFHHVLCQYFLELVEYLLRGAATLENFNFSIAGGRHLEKVIVCEGSDAEKREYLFCNLLRDSPNASMGCEVLFRGKYLLMSQKTGPNILRANGEVVTLD